MEGVPRYPPPIQCFLSLVIHEFVFTPHYSQPVIHRWQFWVPWAQSIKAPLPSSLLPLLLHQLFNPTPPAADRSCMYIHIPSFLPWTYVHFNSCDSLYSLLSVKLHNNSCSGAHLKGHRFIPDYLTPYQLHILKIRVWIQFWHSTSTRLSMPKLTYPPFLLYDCRWHT